MRAVMLSAVFVSVSGAAFALGVTERACLTSERSPGAEVCACAQTVADHTLAPAEQRLAALIIADPDQWLEFKYGRDEGKRAFLERYQFWGEMASQSCNR